MLPNFIYICCLVIHVFVWSWYLQDPSAATWLALRFAWDVVGNVGCELFPLTWMLNKAIINPTRFDSKNYPIVILLLMLTQLSTVVLCVRFLCLDIRYDIFCSCKTPNNCDASLCLLRHVLIRVFLWASLGALLRPPTNCDAVFFICF